MSSFEDLEREGLFTKTELKAIKKRARAKANELKLIRKINDREARRIFKLHYINNGRKWDSKAARNSFRALMSTRHKLHERIARLVPEKIEPEWDSP